MTIRNNDMAKTGITMVVAGMAMLAACSFGRKHSTLVEKTNNNYLRIEYAGHISFNRDRTAFGYISPDGYVEYQYNDKKLEAKNNGKGGVSYELYEGYSKLSPEQNNKFIADAVRVIMQKCRKNGMELN
jgi:hypothetical protein